MSQGYYRKKGSLLWWKNNKVVGGKVLHQKLMEYKSQLESTI